MTEDHYISLSHPSTGLYREKGSKFLAYAYPVSSEEELLEHIESLKKEHPKARHYCYAYRLGPGDDLFRANDDGEPSGTAGRPIMGAINSAGLSDTGVVVVRYFGGTKLGASGLIQAYKKAAADALETASTRDVFITESCKMTFDYGHMGVIMDVLKQLEVEIAQKVLNESPYFILNIRASQFKEKIWMIKARLLNRNPEDINEETIIPYCTFEI
jgi:uncharacterized YigZ family protein